MRVCLAVGLVFVVAVASEHVARAEHPWSRKDRGLGLGLGHPTSVVGRLGISARPVALQAGVGTGVLDGQGLHVYVDVVWSPLLLTENESLWLPFYVGVGGRFYDMTHDRATRLEEGHDGHVGVRIPFGIAVELKKSPIDFFLEAAVVLDVLVTDDCRLCNDDERLGGALVVGARYHFGR